MSATERRNFARIPTHLVAEVRLLGDEAVDKATVIDISRGGSFVETGGPYRPCAEVAVFFHLPQGKEPFALEGIVRWKRENAPRGIGVEFKQNVDPTHGALHQYLLENEPADAPAAPQPRRRKATTVFFVRFDGQVSKNMEELCRPMVRRVMA